MVLFGPRRNKTSTRYLFLSISLAFLLLLTPLSVFAEDTDSIKTLRSMGKAFAQIAEKASPAVVGIKAKQIETLDSSGFRDRSFESPFFDDDFFERFFGSPSPRRRSPQQRKYERPVQGSGFIISTDGYILTNNHLVKNAEDVQVKLDDGRELEAKIIGTDPGSDVALIKIDTDNLSFLKLADSDKLEVGEWVLAIGSPFGLSHTVTAGIVSAKGRSGIGLAAYEDFIQTDAAINPGNSGGPLLNLDGEVVGMNTAIIGSTGNIGIGLAIPINMAKSVRQQLLDTGTVVRGFLGIVMNELTPELAQAFGLEGTKGVAITEVIDDSPAEEAGFKRNDVIVELEGRPVEKSNEFRNRVAMLKPGTKVEIIVLRNGSRKKIYAELGEHPEEGQIAGRRGPDTVEKLGFSVQDLTDDLARRFGYETMSGVIVSWVESGSKIESSGIKPGMLILEVNQTKVTNVSEFNEEMEKAHDQERVLLLIYNGRFSQFVVIKLPERK